MYGIVNKSIEDLVVTNFGKEKWDIIHKKSGVNKIGRASCRERV